MLAALVLLVLQIADPAPDIVVTARPGAPPPARDAADHFTLYCFEANRLSHRSRIPDDDPDWQPVDAATRARLKAMPDAALFALADPRRRQTLVLRIERLARRGGLPWDAILGAEVLRVYKPDPAAYLGTAACLGIAPGDLCLVAAHHSDLAAARGCGLQTAYIDRPQEYGGRRAPDADAAQDWDWSADSLTALADLLDR